ncbi:DUF6247 family protein [Actinomycetospora straminea]|uniref:Uncharacterized protein n=1 Tax=Actinomycetospora straminea TaxID=663607 RepID=A0ABP9F1E8_9PSEU|nr:DUF6247 family protein [Actinomycetospora straminea]MDD7934726.1 DUF6247 family protein [Actinomycetospora straminea]
MSATQHADSGHDPRSLAPGAQPAAIAAALLPADRDRFLASYERELRRARQSLDLTALDATLEQWRGVAAMQSRPEEYRRDLRRAAELITGEPSPEDEPLEVTRNKAGA